jgi:signal transduction histidine kinase/CheY-like chemotaxis protein
MKDTKAPMNRVTKIFLTIVAGLIVLVIVLGMKTGTGTGFNEGKATEIDDSWSYSVDNGTPRVINLPQTRNVPEAQKVQIRNTLPYHIEDGSVVAIYASFQEVTCEINGRQRLAYKGVPGMLETDVPVTAIVFVPVSSQDQGKTISITYSSILSSRKGVLHKILIGDKADIIYYLVGERIVIMVLGIFLMLLGAVVILYKMIFGETGKVGQVLLYQGLYIFLIGMFFLLQAGMNQVFFQDLNWARFLDFFSIMMIPVPMVLAVDTVEENTYRSYADIVCGICIVISIIECFMATSLHMDYIKVVKLSYLSIGIATCYVGITVALIAVQKRDLLKRMKWMLLAILAIMVSGVGEIMMYYINSELEDCRIMAVGVIIHFYFTTRWVMDQVNEREMEKVRARSQAEAKSSFLANMSHEIRTPINAILGLNNLIIDEEKDETVREYAVDMKNSGEQLLTLVNNILNFSKLESGQMKVNNYPFYLVKELQNMALRAGNMAKEKGLMWIFELDDNIPVYVDGDQEKMEQILWNIMNNALKYTKEGSIAFKITVSSEEQEQCNICFTIEDTGEGIQDNTSNRMFQAFHHDSVRDDTKTLGLGLSTADRLSRLLGGNIEVRSEYGKGTEVHIVIPFNVLPVPVDDSDMITESDKNKLTVITKHNSNETRTLNIILVDDDAINRKIGSRVLEQNGIKAVIASGGEEALLKMQDTDFDLVLTDRFMPQMDGVQLFEKINEAKQNRNHNTPVVMLTAESECRDRNELLQMGFMDVICKPLTDEKLNRLLQKICTQEVKE